MTRIFVISVLFSVFFSAVSFRALINPHNRPSKIQQDTGNFASQYQGGVDGFSLPGMNTIKSFKNAGIAVGGALASLEFYACQEDVQNLVSSEIANWARAERYCIGSNGFYSVVFESLDKRRVIHLVTWKFNDLSIPQVFHEYRKRGDGTDGAPVSLKESTHLYKAITTNPADKFTTFPDDNVENYPLFSFDLFNSHHRDKQDDVINYLSDGIMNVKEEIMEDCHALHILKSIDKDVTCVFGEWKREFSFSLLQEDTSYETAVLKAKKSSVQGTYTDLIERVLPSRLYKVVDVFFP